MLVDVGSGGGGGHGVGFVLCEDPFQFSLQYSHTVCEIFTNYIVMVFIIMLT